MEAATAHARISVLQTPFQSDLETVKCRFIHRAVFTTPQIFLTFHWKVLLKPLSKSKSIPGRAHAGSSLYEFHMQVLADEFEFEILGGESRGSTKAAERIDSDDTGVVMLGKPWERLEKLRLRELSSANEESASFKLKEKHLGELAYFLQQRRNEMMWLLDDDIERMEGQLVVEDESRKYLAPVKQTPGAVDATQFLIDRLSATNLSMTDWKFSKMMRQSGLRFTENELLKIVGGLGTNGQWKHALSVVEWVYTFYRRKYDKSRFVYTKLLAVLGKARRPDESLRIFNLMLEDYYIYPDMPAYHCIAVTLGQAGLLRPLLRIIESMKQKPSRGVKNVPCRKWDPCREPDVVVFNAILNASVPLQHWKAVFWVFEQIRKTGLKPNGPTFGLAMEVMLRSGKYDFVHLFFAKCQRSGEALKSLTYKVLVRTYWKEGMIDGAVGAVRDMEQRGVTRTASVYYELARCLCYHGRWQQAMVEVEKLMSLPVSDRLESIFAGMILSSMDGRHIDDCVSIFQHMKHYCDHTIETINAMLGAYGQHDMFSKAKELFNETKRSKTDSESGKMMPDFDTYVTMLEVCGRSHQWEYFVYVYRELVLAGYRLDRPEHAILLVQASRAGKWHLLEHAFDSILESGQIPHPSFFTEMTFQALSQRDCERASAVIRAMCCAHLQVTENEWRKLFWINRDRIGINCVRKLLATIYKSGMAEVEDAAMVNFLGSLKPVKKSRRMRVSRKGRCSDSGSGGVDDDLGICWRKGEEEEDMECEVGELPSAHGILATWKEKRLVIK